MYYIKATYKGGISKYDSNFKYHLGLNVHPNPDKSSNNSCGAGIHLAKSLRSSLFYFPKAEEFYLAKPGVILGEDFDKVRVSYCFIVKLLNDTQLHILRQYEHIDPPAIQEVIIEWGNIGQTGGIAGKDWLDKYLKKYPFNDYKNQGLQLLINDKPVSNITNNIKKTDLKTVLKSHI